MNDGFEAPNRLSIREILKTWGASAPHRLERRGRQKELERFCLRIFLKHLDSSNLLRFPLIVTENENPDFFLQHAENRVGIEVVEACDPNEQAAWTKFQKSAVLSDDDIWRNVDLMDPSRPKKFLEVVQNAVAKKAGSCGSNVDLLLVYANTDCDDFESLDWKLAALRDCRVPDAAFSQIWIISGKDVFELTQPLSE